MKKIYKALSSHINHRPIVTILPVYGVIAARADAYSSICNGVLSDAALAKHIEKAFAPERLCAVVLAINCPGGSPTQSNMLVQRIRKHARKRQVPVYAFCEDAAASAGYMLACAADKIYVNENSIIGAISCTSGNFPGCFDAQTLIEEIGAHRRVRAPSDEINRFTRVKSHIHRMFIDLVKARRGRVLRAHVPGLFEGEIWIGSHAVEVGLADGIGHYIDILEEKFGKSIDIRPIEYSQPFLHAHSLMHPSLSYASSSNRQNLHGNLLDTLYKKAYGDPKTL